MPKLIKRVGQYQIKQPERGPRKDAYYIINEKGDYLSRNGKNSTICNNGWFSSVSEAENLINSIQPKVSFFKKLFNKLFGGNDV